MVCFACSAPARGRLCSPCAAGLQPAADRLVEPGVIVRSAFRHHAAARALVHAVKYRPVAGVTMLLAEAMARRVTSGDVLVPIPRARLRRWSKGIDPALELAHAVGGITGMPVQRCLSAPWWWPRHAGSGRSGRGAVAFRSRRLPSGRPVLIDDVLTTGTTITSAIVAIEVLPALVVTATAAGRMASG